MMRRLWQWLTRPCGPFDLFVHVEWVYDPSEVDALRRPIRRHCIGCGVRMERRYDGMSEGAYGPWEKVT